MTRRKLMLKGKTRKQKGFEGQGEIEVPCYKVIGLTNIMEPPIGKILSEADVAPTNCFYSATNQ